MQLKQTRGMYQDSSEQPSEVVHGYLGSANESAQRARRKFPVLRNRQTCSMTGLD